MAPTLPKLIVIVGPTASGKTALGILLAKRFGSARDPWRDPAVIHGRGGEVISADSRLVYRGMDIGTAKPERGMSDGRSFECPTIHDLFRERPYMIEGVPHWGIDLVNPDEDFNVSQFKAYAEARIKDIVTRGKTPIMVGGTGLWIDAVVDNLSIPEVPPNPAIRAELEPRSVNDLFAEYKRLDPIGAEVIDCHNKRRLVRALEVCRVIGKPFSSMQTKGQPKYDVLKIGINIDKETLNARINERVDEMVAKGLVNEVRALLKRLPPARGGMRGGGSMNELPMAMTGIGYRQIAFFLNGKANLAAAIEDIKRDTRLYAKRQMTWFKRDARIKWVKSVAEAIALVEAV